ncbi:hypothetical protein CDD83_5574 [Cordyceps sp. RAO-2017]|nr:hypothetical protein CDD83_5574 [Cordyceps sp. RAO-2017]
MRLPLLFLAALLGWLCHASCTASCERRVQEVFRFDNNTFIENLVSTTDGRLLLTSLSTNALMVLDPAEPRPTAQTVLTLANVTGLTGITHLGNDVYAVTGGRPASQPFLFERGSMRLFVVSLPLGAVVADMAVEGTAMMNGLASLKPQPHLVLSADSIEGRILRVDTRAQTWDVAFSDDSLKPFNASVFPLGVNGLKYARGHLYYTNSARGTFSRIRVTDRGLRAGPAEPLAALEKPATDRFAYDDFDLDHRGNAYVSLHPSSVRRVSSRGLQSVFAEGGVGNVPPMYEVTATACDAGGSYLYIATGGSEQNPGGQILRASLGETAVD